MPGTKLLYNFLLARTTGVWAPTREETVNQKQINQGLATEANIREMYLANAAERSLERPLPSRGAIWDGPTVFVVPRGSNGLQVCPLAYSNPRLAPGLVLPPGSHQITAWFRVESAPDAGWYELRQDVFVGNTPRAGQLSLTAVDVLGLGRVQASNRTVSPALMTTVRRQVSHCSNPCAVRPSADLQVALQRRVRQQVPLRNQFATVNWGLVKRAEKTGARISEALRDVAGDAAHDALTKAAVRFPQPPKGPGQGVVKRGAHIRPSVSVYGYVDREVKKQISEALKEYREKKEAAEAAGHEYLQLSFDVFGELVDESTSAFHDDSASREWAAATVEQLRHHLGGQRSLRNLGEKMELALDTDHSLTKKRRERLRALAEQYGISA
jgi:hypothetical protein